MVDPLFSYYVDDEILRQHKSDAMLRQISLKAEFLMRITSCMSLKTKGFSRETKALILGGGGENRTLVLSKLHINLYMLCAYLVPPAFAARLATPGRGDPHCLELPRRRSTHGVHTWMYDRSD